ncbi:MAG: alpha/beta fold hydrolase [Desulfopila sp.]
MHYIDVGDGPVVVMVHGNPTWSYYFRRLITRLSANHRVIALDHIGCGLSDKPQNSGYYTLRQHTDNLEALLHSLMVVDYSLVVHDWGGAIGMGLATRYPERVAKIVVLNTAAFRSRRLPWRIRICRWPFLGPFLVRACNGFAWPATFMAVRRPLEKDVAAAYLAPYDSWRNRVAIAAFVRDIPMTPAHPSYAELVRTEQGLPLLRQQSIPMLILWGGKDFCFNTPIYQEWLRRFPEAEHCFFADAGHYVLEDKSEEAGQRIADFLLLAPR